MRPTDLYLTVYNSILLGGWAYVLAQCFLTLQTFDLSKTPSIDIVLGLELFALLEIIHAILGVVPGNPMAALLLHAGRLICVIVSLFPHKLAELQIADLGLTPISKSYWDIWVLFFLWAIAEVVRESFYLTTIWVKTVPYFLVYLRYTVTVVLLPFGFLSEILLFVPLWDQLSQTGKTVLGVYILIAYLFGGSFLVLTMIKARTRKLSPNAPPAQRKQKSN